MQVLETIQRFNKKMENEGYHIKFEGYHSKFDEKCYRVTLHKDIGIIISDAIVFSIKYQTLFIHSIFIQKSFDAREIADPPAAIVYLFGLADALGVKNIYIPDYGHIEELQKLSDYFPFNDENTYLWMTAYGLYYEHYFHYRKFKKLIQANITLVKILAKTRPPEVAFWHGYAGFIYEGYDPAFLFSFYRAGVLVEFHLKYDGMMDCPILVDPTTGQYPLNSLDAENVEESFNKFIEKSIKARRIQALMKPKMIFFWKCFEKVYDEYKDSTWLRNTEEIFDFLVGKYGIDKLDQELAKGNFESIAYSRSDETYLTRVIDVYVVSGKRFVQFFNNKTEAIQAYLQRLQNVYS